MERIIFAAILRLDNCIVFGRDHAECIQKSPPGTCITINQGFLTSKYRFVKRKEAAKIAFDAGQIDKWKDGDIILSEQLWSDGGKYEYDSKVGYIIVKDLSHLVPKLSDEEKQKRAEEYLRTHDDWWKVF